jgi:hypothetical protein
MMGSNFTRNELRPPGLPRRTPITFLNKVQLKPQDIQKRDFPLAQSTPPKQVSACQSTEAVIEVTASSDNGHSFSSATVRLLQAPANP